MLRGERLDRVAVALDRLAGLHFHHVDAKAHPLDAELRCTPQMPAGSSWSPESKRLRPPLERHRPHEPNDPDDMIGVQVREEDVLEHERDSVPHHLALRSFAAVEQHRLSLANERERADVALDRGASGGGAEESQAQGHGSRQTNGKDVRCQNTEYRIQNSDRTI